MDPFTQRMLERARARQEKIDQKLANSGQAVPKRKPLSENIENLKSGGSPVKSPNKIARETVLSPKKSLKESNMRSPNRNSQKSELALVGTPQRVRNDVVVTRKEFKSPRGSRGSVNRRNSDVSVEINISHRNDIQIEVQVEERDAPISVVYDSTANSGSSVTIKEIEEDTSKAMEKESDVVEQRSERAALRTNMKSRLDRLGNLYSDQPLSSPIHRTEADFTCATPPSVDTPRPAAKPDGKRRFGRLAALADQINNWEDDLTHHNIQPQQPEPKKKGWKPEPKQERLEPKQERLDASTLDVSIHSIRDINHVLKSTVTKPQQSKPANNHVFTRPSNNECQRLAKQIVAELEPSAATPSAAAAPNMATATAMLVSPPAISKKPSIKKYKAPTPPRNIADSDSDKDKENNVIQREENDNETDCIQTKPDDKPEGSPVVRKLAPKLNGNVDRSSVLSKAAMFEAGSPRAKDPAEMSLRERKALFEKNKGAAIVPKAPFGMAPSVKTLHADKDKRSAKPTTPTKSNNSSLHSRTNSKDTVADDNISQSSLGGGIKGKLAALFNKEQTISETTIANKFKQERDMEMEMLQNRFHYKPPQKPEHNQDSEDEQSDHDPSEKAPLMRSTASLAQPSKKPEIIANIPKVGFEKTRSETALNKEAGDEKVVGSQPVKRRSSQDSPVVLSVLDDVKRIKVNNKKDPQTNGAVLQQPTSLYPHLSDIETDTSHTQEEYSDCGGSRCGHYTLECVFFFLCI